VTVIEPNQHSEKSY